MRPQRRAFTLIELLLVVGLIGVLAGVALPRVRAVLPGATLRAAGHQVQDALRGARAYALRRGYPVELVYDIDAGTFGIADMVAGAAPPLLEPLPPTARIVAIVSTRNTQATHGRARVTVGPSGQVQAHRVVVADLQGRRITVEVTGVDARLRGGT